MTLELLALIGSLLASWMILKDSFRRWKNEILT